MTNAKKYSNKNQAIDAAYAVIAKSGDANNLGIHEGAYKGGRYECVVVQHDVTGKILFQGYWG